MFEFPVWGVPSDLQVAMRLRKPFNTTSDGRLYRPSVRLRVSAPGKPQPRNWYRLQLDAGADCCVLGQWVAEEIGITRPANAHEERLRTGAGLITAWFAEVDFHLGRPTDPYEFDWTAHVGFVRDEVLPAAFPAGIFGIGGGLERFKSSVLILSPDGPEAPAVRLFT